MKFLFKYPTMGRPEWFKDTIQKYLSMLSGEHEYKFSVAINRDDETMNNQEMLKFIEGLPADIDVRIGDYADKIDAVNVDVFWREFDILFLISDDMIPMVPGFDLIVANHMKEYFPSMDGALHYPDGCCNTGTESAITLSILGGELYKELGYIYHPDYKSFYCDNEFGDVTKRMGKYKFINQVIVKHDWKGGVRGDATYKRNTKLGKGDQATYERRKAVGFPR